MKLKAPSPKEKNLFFFFFVEINKGVRIYYINIIIIIKKFKKIKKSTKRERRQQAVSRLGVGFRQESET